MAYRMGKLEGRMEGRIEMVAMMNRWWKDRMENEKEENKKSERSNKKQTGKEQYGENNVIEATMKEKTEKTYAERVKTTRRREDRDRGETGKEEAWTIPRVNKEKRKETVIKMKDAEQEGSGEENRGNEFTQDECTIGTNIKRKQSTY